MKNSKQVFLAFGSFLFIALLLNSCKPKCEKHPDDPECAGEEELITTLKVFVTDSATNAAIGTFQFQDLDGDGGNAPGIFDTIKIPANKTCKVRLEFWNDAASPAENITTEIEDEKDDHFVAFHAHGVTINYTYVDFDSNNLPVGLQTQWRTGAAGVGEAHITLRHQPGVKDGTAGPGDTDVEVEFPVVLQ